MRTSITLDNLRFRARHGVMEQERAVGNTFVVALRLDYPFEEAMQTDNLEATLNYAEVYEVVKAEMGVPSRLLEHVAGRIRSGLLKNSLKSQADISALRKRGRLLPASRARRLSRWSGDGLISRGFLQTPRRRPAIPHGTPLFPWGCRLICRRRFLQISRIRQRPCHTLCGVAALRWLFRLFLASEGVGNPSFHIY